VDRVIESQHQVIDRFNTEVLKHNVDVLNNQYAQAAVFSEIGRLMTAILQGQKNSETLKEQFISILDSYIRSREAFTMITPAREKEELIAVTKEQVRFL